MSNNYSSDPNRALPVNNMNTPQSGSGDVYVPPLSSPIASRSSAGSSSDSGQSSYAASNSALPESNGMGSRLRLSKGVALSEGRYVIENLVASGGMGAVYRAIDKRFNRPCAVKEMLD